MSDIDDIQARLEALTRDVEKASMLRWVWNSEESAGHMLRMDGATVGTIALFGDTGMVWYGFDGQPAKMMKHEPMGSEQALAFLVARMIEVHSERIDTLERSTRAAVDLLASVEQR